MTSRAHTSKHKDCFEGASATAHVTEVQTVRTTASAHNIDGYFRLTFNGETTKDIEKDAAASTVKDKLERMSTVGTVTVVREESKIELPGWFKAVAGQNYLESTMDMNNKLKEQLKKLQQAMKEIQRDADEAHSTKNNVLSQSKDLEKKIKSLEADLAQLQEDLSATEHQHRTPMLQAITT